MKAVTHGAQGNTRAGKGQPLFWAWSGLLGLSLGLFALGACGERAGQRPDDAFIVLLPREPQELDPRFIGDPYGIKVSRLLHASLFTIDPQNLEVVPDLAERYEQPGPQTYVVTLRPGLTFADGSALDAEDVVATFRGLVDPRVRSRYARSYARIGKVEALDARTVRFELSEPHATFLTDLEMPVLRAEDAYRRPSEHAPLVGAGPYQLTERTVGRLELKANPRWHRGAVRHPLLRLLLVRDDNTRAMRMRAGAADLALNAVPPLLTPMFERDPRFEVDSAPGVGTTYLGVNLEAPVLSDLRVRRALAHALDREAVVRTKYYGRARLARGWIVPTHWAFDAGTPSYPFDAARARRLLDEAGLVPDADGVRARFTLRTSSDRFIQSVARALVSMWRAVGVEVDLRPSEMATLLHDLNKGRFQLSLLEVPEVFEPNVLSWFFSSDHIPLEGVREGSNRWRFRDPQFDAALLQGRRVSARADRIAAYRVAQRRMAEQLPVIPLWHRDVVAVTSPRARGYCVPSDGRFGTLARCDVRRTVAPASTTP